MTWTNIEASRYKLSDTARACSRKEKLPSRHSDLSTNIASVFPIMPVWERRGLMRGERGGERGGEWREERREEKRLDWRITNVNGRACDRQV